MKLMKNKLIRVSKENAKVNMELYIPGVPGPLTIKHIVETDAGIRLHTDVGSFEFGPSDYNSFAVPVDKDPITKEEKLNAKN